jgi:peptidyl-prolyl cis-trans isomerase C
MGMGKSDGAKKKVEEQMTKPKPAPVKTEAVEAKPTKVETVAVETVPVEDKAAVTVNGIEIMQSEIDRQISEQISKMQASGQPIPPAQMNAIKAQMQQPLLQQMIEKLLIDEKLKAGNIEITDKDIDEKIAVLAKRYNMSTEAFQQRIAMSGRGVEDFRKMMRSAAGLEKLMETSGTLASASEEEVKKFYDDKIEAGQMRASHILLKTDDKDETAKAAAKVKIEELLKQAKAGSDFVELARANSDCPSASGGGDLGFFDKGRMVPPFEQAAYALKEGQISDVVETRFGYHIIRRPAFAEIKDEIGSQMNSEKNSKLTMEYLDKLKSEAEIIWPAQPTEVKTPGTPEIKTTAEPGEK